MADIAYIPDQNQANNILPWMYAAQNNGGFGNGANWGGFLAGGLGGILAGALFPNLFGGYRNGGVNGDPGVGYVANQLNNDNGREMIMQAIAGNTSALHDIASVIGQDFNLVQSGINGLGASLASVGSQVGMSALQVVNAIQAGNADIASRFCQCCCDQKVLTLEQTNQLGNAINGVQQAVAAKAAADQLAMCQQTYALTDTMNRDFLALDNKIDALESSRKDREITALTAQVAKLESQNFTAGIVQQAVAPVNAALASLAREVDDIKCKQPNTVSIPYPNLAAVNMTPYVSGGYYQGGFNGLYGSGAPGFGWGNGINF